MSLLVLRGLTLRIAGRTLLDAADLTIEPGRKIGLVGRNGAGKSTLLRAITGELAPDGGEIRLSARARMTHVAQEAPAGETSLIDTVLAADLERAALLAELENAGGERVGEIHDRLLAIGADAAPSRAATVLDGLGFNAEAQARSVGSYSGGWRMRVALACALFLEPDVLLLDEPTNHLDLEATVWLEGWLKRFSGAALIVSHDREMLDNVVDGIAHLEGGKLSLYPGGYESFVRVRTERLAQRAGEAARQQAARAHMQSFVDRFRAQATKARQAQSRLKALEKMPVIESVIEPTPTRFAFPEPGEMAPPILNTRGLAIGYDGNPVLRGLDLRLDPEDRIALLGANGNGKSTLAKLLAGRMEPLAGEVHRTPRLKVGYFAQHQAEELDMRGTPLSHMQAALPKATETACRAQLARFGLDEARATTTVSSLSGGEKARLLLSLCTRDAPGLLILDEPTNHLDIDARDALIRALSDFAGAVVLITHDPHLVSLAADRLWLVGEGTVKPFEGDLDDYKALLLERARAASRPAARGDAAGSRKEDRRERAEARAAQAPLRNRVKKIETALAKLATENAGLEKTLADPALYADSAQAGKIAAATTRQAAIAKETGALEEEWLELQEQLEA